MPLFAVVRTRAAGWHRTADLEDQPEWREHADFMNALQAEGLVLLGGPLDGTTDVLLIMRAGSEEEMKKR